MLINFCVIYVAPCAQWEGTLGGWRGKWCWSYSTQAGKGGSCATAQAPAALPFPLGVSQAAGEGKTLSHQNCAAALSSCIHCLSLLLAEVPWPERERGRAHGSAVLRTDFFRAIWYHSVLRPDCLVPLAAFLPVQGPLLAMGKTEPRVI